MCKKYVQGHDTRVYGDKINFLDLCDPSKDVGSISEDLSVVLKEPGPGHSSAITAKNTTRLTISSFSGVCVKYCVLYSAEVALSAAISQDVASANSLENIANKVANEVLTGENYDKSN